MDLDDLIKIIFFFGVLAVAKSDTPPENVNNNKIDNSNNNNIQYDSQSGFTPLSPPHPSAMENLNLFESAGFDPNLYQAYMPHDAVQKYVSSFGGPYPPTPYSATYDPDNNEYRVEDGFEGYLVPQLPDGDGTYPDLNNFISHLPQGLIPVFGAVKTPEKSLAPALKTVLSPFGLEWLISLIPKGLLTVISVIFGVIVKVGAILLGAAAAAGVGGLIVHLVCSLTSICSLTLNKLAIPFHNWTEHVKSNMKDKIAHTVESVAETVDHVNHHLEQEGTSAENTIHISTNDVEAKEATHKVAEAGRTLDLTPDRITRATEFVRSAIKKYEELQKAGGIESIDRFIDEMAA